MSGTISTQGQNTSLIFTYTTTTDNMLLIAGDAAHYLWNGGHGDHGTEDNPISFDSLTNQQKVDIIDSFLLKCALNCADSYKIDSAINEAKAEAGKYNL